MARTIWKGSLNFGLVNVPVGLYPATAEKTVRFNQFEAGTADRIRYKKVNERTGDEVATADIVRGVDLGGGEYVLLSDEELAAAEPVRSRLIELTDFVAMADIDPVYFRSTYYLAPEGEAAEKAYALLRSVMADAHKVAIGTLVMRNKEYPVAIRPGEEGVLVLQTLYFPDEIRQPDQELPGLPEAVALSAKETAMAELLVQSMENDWDPARYEDTHRQKVQALIEAKRQGHEIVTEAPAPAAPVVDLMEALTASIDEARAKGKATSATGKATAQKAATPRAKGRATTAAKPRPTARTAKATPKPRRKAS
jgi:DNA end-binding protein Ku